jgi:predicted restriction endonuclease
MPERTTKDKFSIINEIEKLGVNNGNMRFCSNGFRYAIINFANNVEKYSLLTQSQYLIITQADYKKMGAEGNIQNFTVPEEMRSCYKDLKIVRSIETNIGAAPMRVAYEINRIVRDTDCAQKIKILHDYRCQLCGETLLLSNGVKYAEAHHIMPLGGGHNGPDTKDNILCVCPNHHVQLDYKSIPIDARNIRTKQGHTLNQSYIDGSIPWF